MKKKFFVAALAATMFATTAIGLAACSKDGATVDNPSNDNGSGNNPPFTITLDANEHGTFTGGKTRITITTNGSGIVAEQPAQPTAESTDYSFRGWGLSASAISTLSFPRTFTEDRTIYALWDTNGNGGGGGGGQGTTSFTITFDAQGGTFTDDEDVAPVTRTTDSSGKILQAQTPDVEYTGYTFNGWYTETNGGGSLVTSATFTANDTVYAYWTQNGNGGGGNGGGNSGGDNSNSELNYTEIGESAKGAWLVGEIASKSITWDTGGWGNGFVMDENTAAEAEEYMIIVYLEADDVVKVRYNGDGVGYSQLPDNEWNGTAPGLAHVTNDGDDNIVIKDSGYYTFYFKATWGSDKLWLLYSETQPE